MTTAIQCKCDRASCTFPANVRRQLTQYNDEASNWACLCTDHQQEADDYWNERLACYYADQGFSYLALQARTT